MNEQNLTPFDAGEPERARTAGRNGGIASGKSRRQKRALKRALHEMLSVQLPDDEAEKLKVYGIDAENADYQAAVAAALVKKAVAGNVNAIQLLATLTCDDPYVQARQADVRLKRAELKEKQREYDLDREDRQNAESGDDDAVAVWLDAVIAMHTNSDDPTTSGQE